MIIGLDQWTFNENYNQRNNNSFKLNRLNLPFLFFDKIKKINGISLIGQKSITNFSGFRADGSYFDGKRFLVSEFEKEDYLFKNTFDRIEKGNKKFEYGNNVDLIQLLLLENILKFCKENDIQVYGFSSPFAPSVIKKMKTGKYNYSYINKSSQLIKYLFRDYDYNYKDFTDYNLFDDTFYLDGSHCNRNVYYQILKDLNITIDTGFDNEKELSKGELIIISDYFNK